MSYICIHFSRINIELFFKSDLIVCVVVVLVFVVVNITVFRVSVALPCIPITPISSDTILKMPELLPLVHVCIATTAEV